MVFATCENTAFAEIKLYLNAEKVKYPLHLGVSQSTVNIHQFPLPWIVSIYYSHNIRGFANMSFNC